MIAGSLTYDTELNTSGFKKGLKEVTNSTQQAGSNVKSIIAGLGITKLIEKGLSVINQNLDAAITRFDTMNNFPKVMQNLGIGAEESSESIKLMSDRLAGLPTTLDEGARAVQRFTSKNGNVRRSTEMFLAVNNAILAGGTSAELQANALEQVSQAYSKGKADMMEWRTIQMAMPAQLKQIATAMGMTVEQLGAGLRGATKDEAYVRKVTMEEFMGTITKLNEEGAEGFASFEEQARTSTNGIKTAVVVAKTQVVKGITDILDAVNTLLKENDLPSVQEIIANMGKRAKIVLDKVAEAIKKIPIKEIFKWIDKLSPLIVGLLAAIAAYKIFDNVMKIVNAVKMLFSALASNPVGLVIMAIAALAAAFIVLWKKSEAFRNFWINLWEKVKKVLLSVKEALQPMINFTKQALQRIWEDIKSIWENIKTIIDILQPYIQPIIEAIKTYITYVIDVIKNAFLLAWQIIQGIWEVAVSFFQTIWDTIAGIFEVVKDVLSGDFQGAWDAIKGIFLSWDSFFQSIWNAIKNVFAGGVRFIINVFQSAWNAIKGIFSNLGKFFSQLWESAGNIGKNIVEGIWQGIQNAKNWLLSKIKEWCGSILNGIKAFFGIHSPSKVMAKEVGQWLPKGISVGIDANTDSIDKSIDAMNEDIKSRMKQAVSLGLGETNATANVRSNSMYKSTIQLNASFEGNVELDGQKTGRILAPSISRAMKVGGLA